MAKNLQVGEPGNSIDRPLYLPGFQSWEHVLECHDPLTDIFTLGMESMISTLSSYREREVDLDFELRAIEFTDSNQHDKRTVVLGKLKNRLFDVSRRNRLLQLQPTMQSINLTHASVPLSFNVENIRTNQILTWSGKFEADMRAGKAVSLSSHLNFSEVL